MEKETPDSPQAERSVSHNGTTSSYFIVDKRHHQQARCYAGHNPLTLFPNRRLSNTIKSIWVVCETGSLLYTWRHSKSSLWRESTFITEQATKHSAERTGDGTRGEHYLKRFLCVLLLLKINLVCTCRN